MAGRLLGWHHVAILLTVIPICAGIISGCECKVYDLMYMYCDCCPKESPGYAFAFDYVRSNCTDNVCDKQWQIYPSRNCEDNRHLDPSRQCDCVFCGTIRDQSNQFYKTCLEMEDKDFFPKSNYELTISYTNIYDTGNISHTITANDSILVPSSPSFVNWSSYLQDDESVAMDILWKPNLYLNSTQLEYTLLWEAPGFSNSMKTEARNMTLKDLIPNTVYNISILCKHPASLYRSGSVSLITRSAEKKPTSSPELLNFQATGDCSDQSKCNITLFWKSLTKEYQSANCTGYNILITGDEFALNQSADCDDVMTVISEPLSRSIDYDIALHLLTKFGPSPPSQLTMPNKDGVVGSVKEPLVVIERNVTVVTVYVRWDQEDMPPTSFEVLYCKGTVTDKCQANVKKERMFISDNRNATLWINNPGNNFLFNIATYWENKTLGLQEEWLCVFDICGDLEKPVVALAEVQNAESLNITIKEAWCPPIQENRGRAIFYQIEWYPELHPKEVKAISIEAFGPMHVKLEGLYAHQWYVVRVRSQGCDKYSSWISQTFKTSENARYLLPSWAIGLLVTVVFLLVVALIGYGLWFYRRRIISVKKELKNQPDNAGSVISWLEKNDFGSQSDVGDYASIEPNTITKSEAAESDSGIREDEESDVIICCSCIKDKIRAKRRLPQNQVEGLKIATISATIDKRKRMSLPSRDSGHSDGSSGVEMSTKHENKANASDYDAVERGFMRTEGVFESGIVTDKVVSSKSLSGSDGYQPESGISAYASQASPLSSMNGPFVGNSGGRVSVTQQSDSKNTDLEAKPDPDRHGDNHAPLDSKEKRIEFIPNGVSVPGFDNKSFSMTSYEEESSCGELIVKKDPDYLAISNKAPDYSLDDDNSVSSDNTDEMSSDSSLSFVPEVTINIKTDVKLPKNIKNNNTTNIVSKKYNNDKPPRRIPLTESEKLDLPIIYQDVPEDQLNCNHDMNCLEGNQLKISSESAEPNSSSISETPYTAMGDGNAQCNDNTRNSSFESDKCLSENDSQESDIDFHRDFIDTSDDGRPTVKLKLPLDGQELFV